MEKIQFRDASESDISWLVDRHVALYTEEAGFNDEFGPVVTTALHRYFEGRDPLRERAFVPISDGRKLGSLFVCRSDGSDLAQLRLFWLEPKWRGQGLAQRMLARAIAFSRAAGYQNLLVRTYDRHVAACRLYAKTGFDLVSENPVHSFGQDMVEQAWRRSV